MYNNAGGWCDTCFCFRDIRRAITAIGMFSLVTSTLQILVQVAVFTGMNEQMKDDGNKLDVDGSEKEKITYQLYIALAAMDFVIAVFAIILLYGNERTDEVQGRKFLMPWAILILFYILYESAINIYYFYHQFNDKYQDPLKKGHPLGFTVVPLVYWIIKDILLFIGFVFVIMRIQSLRPVIQYVEAEYSGGCRDCEAPPAPVVRVNPPIALPTPVVASCSSCNACSGNRCGCSKPVPLYGYAGAQSSNVAKSGWTTSIYNQGR